MKWEISKIKADIYKADSYKEISVWVSQQSEKSVPRYLILEYLGEYLTKKIGSMAVEGLQKISKIESELHKVMVDRNLDGKDFERAGKIEEAIQLYEANISDWFPGSYPYERLRIIYNRQKKYSEAIRICKEFLKVADFIKSQAMKRGNQLPEWKMRKVWENWIKKLERKNFGKDYLSKT